MSQEALAIDQLPDDVMGTDNLLAQCRAEPRNLNTVRGVHPHTRITRVIFIFSRVILAFT